MLAQASPLFGSAVHYTAAMNDATAPPAPARIADEKRRFLFEEMDLRGELVHLDAVLSDIASIHAYPVGVQALLGEFLAASVLLASTLKFRGTLTVQARSDAQIPLIMAECSSALEVRAIARGAQEAVAEEFNELLEAVNYSLPGQPISSIDARTGRSASEFGRDVSQTIGICRKLDALIR